jgi:Spy/CpxP family protein refolding chaperone
MKFKPVPTLIARAVATASLAAMIAATGSLAVGPVMAAQVTSATKIESHLQDMHAKLHITAEQEDQWKPVAQAMRDNEAAIAPLIEQRKASASTMSAIDDLKSYAQITSAHADGIKNFTAVFEPLYAAMSDSQKKDADTLFRSGFAKTTKTK